MPNKSRKSTSKKPALSFVIRERLDHELEKAGVMNTEAIAFGHLYHHAPTKVRQLLWSIVARNPCTCWGCRTAELRQHQEPARKGGAR